MLESALSASVSFKPGIQNINSLLVNDHGVTALAVTHLSAVDPHGGGAVDLNGEGGNHARLHGHGRGHEARVNTSGVGVEHADRSARVVEVGLRNGVVASQEMELDKVALVDPDVVGGERPGAIPSDIDDGNTTLG